MNEADYIDLLNKCGPLLERNEKLPPKDWKFTREEVNLLEKLYGNNGIATFPPDVWFRIVRRTIISLEQYKLLSLFHMMIVTRFVHGIDPKTGQQE
jgi:hypothetical protein